MSQFFLVVVGLWLFFQVVKGRLVDNLTAYKSSEPATVPDVTVPTGRPRGGSVRVRAGVRRPRDPAKRAVLQMLRLAAARTGNRYEVTSWWRRGATVAGTNRRSCHADGSAVDVVPAVKGAWRHLDELHQAMISIGWRGEIIWRGVPGHDPDIRDGTIAPHLHAAWECG